MRFLIMLVVMILVAEVVSAAEEMNETLSVNETVNDGMVDEIVQEANNSLLSGESAQFYGAIHRKIIMIAEEGFGYLLTGNETEKQAFLDEYASLAEDYAAFEKSIDLAAGENAELKTAYDELGLASDALGPAAETMFASYDANKTVVLEDAIAFEDAVDVALMHAQNVWDIENITDTGPLSLNAVTGRLKVRLLEAIEESYAYPVLGNITEKEDALAKFSEFDEILMDASELYPDTSFEELATAKAEIAQAADTMFKTYEADGKVSADEVASLESSVEAFNMAIFPSKEN